MQQPCLHVQQALLCALRDCTTLAQGGMFQTCCASFPLRRSDARWPGARDKPWHPRPQRADSRLCAGEESIKAANQQRYEERLRQGYSAFRQERLASAEVACRRLISDFTQRITQVGCRPQAHGSITA